ncbi:class II fructose-bisphosphate aldolase family protein [Candidatus Nomurabacteria bacterium]|nr:class II fructose-bisphosphate aldolase family protein [Candidatus Nomurabacteria bacterium]USN94922.1 MAG: class II fructose-bisphosphate aldolase family protein [Candidatus Nomurabacteria bacterium]
MKTLKEYIQEARDEGYALGHFNFSTIGIFNGIISAARKTGKPVILGLSEGEESFVGLTTAVAMVRNMREKEGIPVFLNADHHYSFEKVKAAIDAGFDMVIVDGAKLPYDENVALTKQCVEYAKEIMEKEGREVLVEGELGYIGSSSKNLEEIPEGITMTDPEEAKSYSSDTGIHILAPAIGNIHGMVKGGNPRIDVQRVKDIKEATGLPLVLHGGSGITDEDFVEAIKAGVSVVHINTEIRNAYKNALKLSLQDDPEEIAPYKILKPAVDAVSHLIEERINLFSVGK